MCCNLVVQSNYFHIRLSVDLVLLFRGMTDAVRPIRIHSTELVLVRNGPRYSIDLSDRDHNQL